MDLKLELENVLTNWMDYQLQNPGNPREVIAEELKATTFFASTLIVSSSAAIAYSSKQVDATLEITERTVQLFCDSIKYKALASIKRDISSGILEQVVSVADKINNQAGS